MIPISVFLSRYTPETVSKASSLIEVSGEIAKMPGGDRLARWSLAFKWVCENAGGMDQSKTEKPDPSLQDLQWMAGSSLVVGDYCAAIAQRSVERIESLSAELAELRAQMLSDQGRHDVEMGRLRDAIERHKRLMLSNEDLPTSISGGIDRSLWAVLDEAVVKESLTTAPAAPPRTPKFENTENGTFPLVVTLNEEGLRAVREGPGETPRTCETCNGHGLLSRFLHNGGGYDVEPCPDCNPKPNTPGDGELTMGDAL